MENDNEQYEPTEREIAERDGLVYPILEVVNVRGELDRLRIETLKTLPEDLCKEIAAANSLVVAAEKDRQAQWFRSKADRQLVEINALHTANQNIADENKGLRESLDHANKRIARLTKQKTARELPTLGILPPEGSTPAKAKTTVKKGKK